MTHDLGAAFYGIGYLSAVVLTTIVGAFVLYLKLNKLEYETFMFQK